MLTIILTVFGMLVIQRAMTMIAVLEVENELLDEVAGFAYSVCHILHWTIPVREQANHYPDLERYTDGYPSTPLITRIVVPSEYAREQVALACRYLHDRDIDTDYMAVNYLVHLYMDADGEQGGDTPWIVVEAPKDASINK